MTQGHQPGVTADSARAIGDCAIRAMSAVTGADWDTVFAHAQTDFTRTGLNAGGIARTLRALGWQMQPLYPVLDLTAGQAERYLQAHHSLERVLAQIIVRRMRHVIAFSHGRFQNLQGATRARIRLADLCTRL